MLRLDSNRTLSPNAQAHLDTLQRKVLAKTSFAAQADAAQSLWKGKSSSEKGENSFAEIRKTLAEMCVSEVICNYCEHNEGNDIEHIYPKSFFPEHAFVWDNYLLACKQCNSGYKLDECHVIDAAGILQHTQRGNQPPPHTQIALINPRAENPAQFMLLNTSDFRFEVLDGLSATDILKATETLRILELNTRSTLLEARKAAAKYFYQRVELLSRILRAETIEEIAQLLTPYDEYLDESQDIDAIKTSIKNGFQRDITHHAHPSVWYAIKNIDSKVTPQWIALFNAIPEALTW
jgi:uncharacterized protein (TIGR02646 family)